jgi:prefoldin subunit 5
MLKEEELDNLVGKPELSIEKKIEMAESSLEKQIDALQDEITNGQIEFKRKTRYATV